MSEWQPIETMPRDGTVVLGYWPPTDEHPNSRHDLVKVKRNGICIAGGAHRGLHSRPTHWMPLPEPPKS